MEEGVVLSPSLDTNTPYLGNNKLTVSLLVRRPLSCGDAGDTDRERPSDYKGGLDCITYEDGLVPRLEGGGGRLL
jgi:hypothetical protein